MAKIGFTIDAKGKVTDVKIVEKDNDKLGQAGAEIISKMPQWKPGMQRGKAVPVKYLMEMRFHKKTEIKFIIMLRLNYRGIFYASIFRPEGTCW